MVADCEVTGCCVRWHWSPCLCDFSFNGRPFRVKCAVQFFCDHTLAARRAIISCSLQPRFIYYTSTDGRFHHACSQRVGTKGRCSSRLLLTELTPAGSTALGKHTNSIISAGLKPLLSSWSPSTTAPRHSRSAQRRRHLPGQSPPDQHSACLNSLALAEQQHN